MRSKQLLCVNINASYKENPAWKLHVASVTVAFTFFHIRLGFILDLFEFSVQIVGTNQITFTFCFCKKHAIESHCVVLYAPQSGLVTFVYKMISPCWQCCEKHPSQRFHWKCTIQVDYFFSVTIRFLCQCFSLEVYDGRMCKWKQKPSCKRVGTVFLRFFFFFFLH